MKFSCRRLDGETLEISFSDLRVVADGPNQLQDGWQADRVNYAESFSIFIEFRSGLESPPGVVPSEAVEVTEEYVRKNYGSRL